MYVVDRMQPSDSDNGASLPTSSGTESPGDDFGASPEQRTPAGATGAGGDAEWDVESIFGPDPLMSGACDQYVVVPLDAVARAGSPALLQLEAPRRSAKSKRGGCSFCRRQRTRCCGQRPCLNCVARGLACTDPGGPDMVQVKAPRLVRPVPFKRCVRVTADRIDKLAESAVQIGLPPMLIVRMAEAGFEIKALMDFVIRLPPAVRGVLDDWLPVLGKHFKKLAENSEAMHVLTAKLPQPAVSPDASEKEPADTGMSVEAINEMVECDTWYSLTYDLVNGGRKYLKFGAGIAEFMDCHAEELSARMAANELPLCSSEVEMFCVMIYNLVGPMEPISFHNNGRPSAMQTVLVNRLLPGVGLGKSSNSEPIIALQRFIRVLDKCGRMTVPGTLVHIQRGCHNCTRVLTSHHPLSLILPGSLFLCTYS